MFCREYLYTVSSFATVTWWALDPKKVWTFRKEIGSVQCTISPFPSQVGNEPQPQRGLHDSLHLLTPLFHPFPPNYNLYRWAFQIYRCVCLTFFHQSLGVYRWFPTLQHIFSKQCFFPTENILSFKCSLFFPKLQIFNLNPSIQGPMCWRKGHGGDPSETCPFATLKEASRQRSQWSHVRCAACGERGVWATAAKLVFPCFPPVSLGSTPPFTQ